MAKHQYVRASNGIGIKFRSRYKPHSFYNVYLPGSSEPRELRHADDGRVDMQYGGEVSAEIATAFEEYKAAEHAAYLQWRQDNASLFV